MLGGFYEGLDLRGLMTRIAFVEGGYGGIVNYAGIVS